MAASSKPAITALTHAHCLAAEGLILFYELGNTGIPADAPTRVYDQSEPTRRLIPFRDCPTPVLRLVLKKIVQAEGIGGEQPVTTHVPVGGVPRIAYVIDNSVSPLLAVGNWS